MGSAYIPEVSRRQLEEAERLAVGQELDVFYYDTDGRQSVARPVDELITGSIDEVFERTGIPMDSELKEICRLVARVSIGRLVSGEGFRVKYGDFFNPREQVDVTLRPPVNFRKVTADISTNEGES
jgi:hypothetical protein